MNLSDLARQIKPYIQRWIDGAFADGGRDLGTALTPFGTIYADISAGTMTGVEWEISGPTAVIDVNLPGGVGTVYVTNQTAYGTANLNVKDDIVLGGTVDGVDLSAFALTVAMNADLDMEAMRIAFNAISWAQFAIWETFDDESRRGAGEPDDNEAVIVASTLTTGSAAPGYSAKWISSFYADMTEVRQATATAVGVGYLEDSAADWFVDQYKGFVLIDSAATEFGIVTSTVSPRRLTVSGTPAAGLYRITAGDPAYGVVFCTYMAANNGGYGNIIIEVTFDGGSHWLTVLETSGSTDMIGGIIEMAWPGDSYAFRITLTNDGAGNSPVVYRILVCTDPSVWQ
jgi:hypothetical protein